MQPGQPPTTLITLSRVTLILVILADSYKIIKIQEHQFTEYSQQSTYTGDCTIRGYTH